MSLFEGAVKKPIMTSLCFLAVAIFGLFFVKITGGSLPGYRDQHHYGDDFLCGSQCVGY